MLEVVESVGKPLSVGPVVVVEVGAECVECGSVAGYDDVAAVVGEALECAGYEGEAGFKSLSGDGLCVAFAVDVDLAYLSGYAAHAAWAFGTVDLELFGHLCVAGFGPWAVAGEAVVDVEVVFVAGFDECGVEGDGVDLALAGLECDAGSLECVAGLYGLSVFVEGPCGGVVVEGCEVVFVEYFDLSFGDVNGCYGDVLVDFFDFGELWFGREVAEEYAVHDELSVGGAVAEVASECEVALACLGVVVVEALVDPVPDGSSDEEVGAFDCVPVVDEVAEGVAHGVGVFGDVEGVVEFHFAFYGFVDPCDGGVLVGADVDDVVVAFVLYGACGVEGFDGVVGCDEVFAWSGFVAEAPDDD